MYAGSSIHRPIYTYIHTYTNIYMYIYVYVHVLYLYYSSWTIPLIKKINLNPRTVEFKIWSEEGFVSELIPELTPESINAEVRSFQTI